MEKILAQEKLEKDPEYIRQQEEARKLKEAEDDKKCDEVIAQCRANIQSVSLIINTESAELYSDTRFPFKLKSNKDL